MVQHCLQQHAPEGRVFISVTHYTNTTLMRRDNWPTSDQETCQHLLEQTLRLFQILPEWNIYENCTTSLKLTVKRHFLKQRHSLNHHLTDRSVFIFSVHNPNRLLETVVLNGLSRNTIIFLFRFTYSFLGKSLDCWLLFKAARNGKCCSMDFWVSVMGMLQWILYH